MPLNDVNFDTVRWALISEHNLVESEDREIYNDIVSMAASIADAPIAVFTIVDKYKAWYKAKIGTPRSEISLEYSFCARAIETPEQHMEILDPTRDSRFSANPFVTDNPGIKYYYGIPLLIKESCALGTLCVADYKFRKKLKQSQIFALTILARQIIDLVKIKKYLSDIKVCQDKNLIYINEITKHLSEIQGHELQLAEIIKNSEIIEKNRLKTVELRNQLDHLL